MSSTMREDDDDSCCCHDGQILNDGQDGSSLLDGAADDGGSIRTGVDLVLSCGHAELAIDCVEWIGDDKCEASTGRQLSPEGLNTHSSEFSDELDAHTDTDEEVVLIAADDDYRETERSSITRTSHVDQDEEKSRNLFPSQQPAHCSTRASTAVRGYSSCGLSTPWATMAIDGVVRDLEEISDSGTNGNNPSPSITPSDRDAGDKNLGCSPPYSPSLERSAAESFDQGTKNTKITSEQSSDHQQQHISLEENEDHVVNEAGTTVLVVEDPRDIRRQRQSCGLEASQRQPARMKQAASASERMVVDDEDDRSSSADDNFEGREPKQQLGVGAGAEQGRHSKDLISPQVIHRQPPVDETLVLSVAASGRDAALSGDKSEPSQTARKKSEKLPKAPWTVHKVVSGMKSKLGLHSNKSSKHLRIDRIHHPAVTSTGLITQQPAENQLTSSAVCSAKKKEKNKCTSLTCITSPDNCAAIKRDTAAAVNQPAAASRSDSQLPTRMRQPNVPVSLTTKATRDADGVMNKTSEIITSHGSTRKIVRQAVVSRRVPTAGMHPLVTHVPVPSAVPHSNAAVSIAVSHHNCAVWPNPGNFLFDPSRGMMLPPGHTFVQHFADNHLVSSPAVSNGYPAVVPHHHLPPMPMHPGMVPVRLTMPVHHPQPQGPMPAPTRHHPLSRKPSITLQDPVSSPAAGRRSSGAPRTPALPAVDSRKWRPTCSDETYSPYYSAHLSPVTSPLDIRHPGSRRSGSLEMLDAAVRALGFDRDPNQKPLVTSPFREKPDQDPTFTKRKFMHTPNPYLKTLFMKRQQFPHAHRRLQAALAAGAEPSSQQYLKCGRMPPQVTSFSKRRFSALAFSPSLEITEVVDLGDGSVIEETRRTTTDKQSRPKRGSNNNGKLNPLTIEDAFESCSEPEQINCRLYELEAAMREMEAVKGQLLSEIQILSLEGRAVTADLHRFSRKKAGLFMRLEKSKLEYGIQKEATSCQSLDEELEQCRQELDDFRRKYRIVKTFPSPLVHGEDKASLFKEQSRLRGQLKYTHYEANAYRGLQEELHQEVKIIAGTLISNWQPDGEIMNGLRHLENALIDQNNVLEAQDFLNNVITSCFDPDYQFGLITGSDEKYRANSGNAPAESGSHELGDAPTAGETIRASDGAHTAAASIPHEPAAASDEGGSLLNGTAEKRDGLQSAASADLDRGDVFSSPMQTRAPKEKSLVEELFERKHLDRLAQKIRSESYDVNLHVERLEDYFRPEKKILAAIPKKFILTKPLDDEGTRCLQDSREPTKCQLFKQ